MINFKRIEFTQNRKRNVILKLILGQHSQKKSSELSSESAAGGSFGLTAQNVVFKLVIDKSE